VAYRGGIWGGPVLALISYYFLKIYFDGFREHFALMFSSRSRSDFYLVTITNGLVTMRMI